MTDKEIDYKILQRENENLLKANKDLVREIEEIQSYLTDKVAGSKQAVKEFAEKLKIAFHFYIVKNEDTGEEINTDDFIDELLKEYEK